MALQMKFRSAFNGFHREDVVNYITRVNHEHETRVNGLENELVTVKEQLDREREKTADLLAQCDALRAQAAENRAREELELFRQAERTQREAQEQAAQAKQEAEALVNAAREKAGTVLAEALENTERSRERVEELSRELALLRQGLEAGREALQEEQL